MYSENVAEYLEQFWVICITCSLIPYLIVLYHLQGMWSGSCIQGHCAAPTMVAARGDYEGGATAAFANIHDSGRQGDAEELLSVDLLLILW